MFIKNAIYKFGSYIIITILTLSSVPIIINNLGIDRFGFVGVINSIVAYISIVTISITSTLSRNIIFAIKKNDIIGANKEFNSVIILLFLLSLILIPVFFKYSPLVIYELNVPINYYDEASFLLNSSIVVFFISTLSSVFSSLFVVKNKLYLQSNSDFINKFSLYTFAILSIVFYDKSLYAYAYAYALIISSIMTIIYNVVLSNRLLAEIKIKINIFSFSFIKIKNNFHLSFWMIINQIGAVLYSQSSIIIISKYFGSKEAGIYALIMIIANQIRSIGFILSSLFQTILMNKISEGDIFSANKYLLKSVFFINISISFVCGMYIGHADSVLNIWVGNVTNKIYFSSILVTIYLPFTVSMSPIFIYLMAFKDIKKVGLLTLFFGVLNFLLCFFLANFNYINMYGIIMITMIILVIQNNIILPRFLIVYNVNIKKINKIHLTGMGYMFFVYVISSYISKIIKCNNYFELVISLILSVVIISFITYLYLAIKIRSFNVINIIRSDNDFS
ncbi:oligosaccharide flippase family protein [Photobacterium piscicola]|uniref:lipopolysaccharide biosynthesis protein n=1 Tax=Photobacterium piscicola TaxID=1378299 RepID=UPI002E185CD1|nr:oligosaccharide flippase family protein [Photobacterium piscicola]